MNATKIVIYTFWSLVKPCNAYDEWFSSFLRSCYIFARLGNTIKGQIVGLEIVLMKTRSKFSSGYRNINSICVANNHVSMVRYMSW